MAQMTEPKKLKQSNFTIRLDEVEKAEWKAFAGENFNNNLARMIRVAVNQLMNPTVGGSAQIDREMINQSIHHAVRISPMNDTLERVESRLDTIADKLGALHPETLEMLDIITSRYIEGEEQEKAQKIRRTNLNDF